MLKINQLSKVFNPNSINENKVFDKLSVEIDKGDFVTIMVLMELENLLY